MKLKHKQIIIMNAGREGKEKVEANENMPVLWERRKIEIMSAC